MKEVGEVLAFGNRYDWLHPQHGITPDKVFLIDHLNTTFTCALWIIEKVTCPVIWGVGKVICMMEEDGEKFHLGHSRTYLWKIENERLVYSERGKESKSVPPLPNLLLQVAELSVEIYVTE